jgi:hypothetical protein
VDILFRTYSVKQANHTVSNAWFLTRKCLKWSDSGIERVVVTRGWEGRGALVSQFNGYRLSVWEDGKALEVVVSCVTINAFNATELYS